MRGISYLSAKMTPSFNSSMTSYSVARTVNASGRNSFAQFNNILDPPRSRFLRVRLFKRVNFISDRTKLNRNFQTPSFFEASRETRE